MSMNFTSQDGDLTNLNWVAGTPVPINCSVSPKDTKATRGTAAISQPVCSSGVRTMTSTASIRPIAPRSTLCQGHQSQSQLLYKKPSCSYTCLIAMALKTSSTRSLPVNEIYKYIEREFPFFLTAPDGWKNSIRHNLSLSQSFRKVDRSEGWRGKKGYYWEVNPERQATLDREMEKFLRQEGRGLVQNLASDSTPIPAHLQASVPSMPRHSITPVCSQSPPTHRTLTPQVKLVDTVPDRPEALVTPEQAETWTAFQTTVTPTQYIGLDPQSMSSQMVAREVLGTDLCIRECNWPYPPENNFGYSSWYTTYTPPVVGLLEDSSFPSPFFSETPPALSQRYYSPIAGAPPYPLYPTIDTSGNTGTPSSMVRCGEWLLQTPVSLQDLEDPASIKDLLELNLFDASPQEELEVEDPLSEISKTKKSKKGVITEALQGDSPPRPRTRAAVKRNAVQSNLGHCPTATKDRKVSGKYSSGHSNLIASPANGRDGTHRIHSTEARSKDNGKMHMHVTAEVTVPENGSSEKLRSSEPISKDPSMLSDTISNDVMVEGVNDSTTSQSACTTAVSLLDSSDDNLNVAVLDGYAAEVVVPATHDDQELPQLDLQNEPLLLTA